MACILNHMLTLWHPTTSTHFLIKMNDASRIPTRLTSTTSSQSLPAPSWTDMHIKTIGTKKLASSMPTFSKCRVSWAASSFFRVVSLSPIAREVALSANDFGSTILSRTPSWRIPNDLETFPQVIFLEETPTEKDSCRIHFNALFGLLLRSAWVRAKWLLNWDFYSERCRVVWKLHSSLASIILVTQC